MAPLDFKKLFGQVESFVGRALLLPDEVKDALAVARELIERGNAAEAVRVVEPLVEKYPKFSEPPLFVGVACEKMGEWSRAEVAYDAALKRGAAPEEVLPALGRVREARLDWKGAEDAYREAIRVDEHDAPSRIGLARVALRTADYDRAAALSQPLASDDSEAALLGAVAQFRAGHLADALRTIRLAPNLGVAETCWEGRIVLAQGDARAALSLATRARDGGAAILALKAEALAALGERDEAARVAQGARSMAPSRGTTALVARFSEPLVALALYEEALAQGDAAVSPWDPMPATPSAADLHLAAARCALAISDHERAESHIDAGVRDGATAFVELRATVAEARRDFETAQRLWEEAYRASRDPASLLAAGRAALERGARDDAARLLSDATARNPELPGLPEALGRLYAAVETVAHDGLDSALRRFHEIASRDAASDAARTAASLAEELHRPLVLAVMGEFSSGKSTFVNAFLGAEVLPMGVTPTTATVNLIRYGPERAARAVRASGEVEAISLDELRGFIDRRLGADPLAIREVEILWPAPELLDVSILDTPGFNAVAPGHEEAAAALLARADAVVWLFDAGQAGRGSERPVLESLDARGIRVLGVLNKADRLSEDDVAKVLALLASEVPRCIRAILPVSARRALKARVAHEAATVEAGRALADSGYPALRDRLERDFFADARALKRDVIRQRLAAATASMRATIEARKRAFAERASAIEAAKAATSEIVAPLGARLTDGVLSSLNRAYRDVAAAIARDAQAHIDPETPFRGPRLRESAEAMLGRSLSSRIVEAVAAERAVAEHVLEETHERVAAAWAALQPADAHRWFVANLRLAGALFLAETFGAFEAHVRAVLSPAAAADAIRDAVTRAKGGPDTLAAALVASLPSLGAHLRGALVACSSRLSGSYVAPARDLAEAVARDRLILETSLDRPLAGLVFA